MTAVKIEVAEIKKLKELSGAGLTDAKQALVAAGGDFDKALEAMRKKGLTKAEKRGDRETREGLIEAYVHEGRIGALVEVNCETSFVAKTPEFKELAHYLAMQVASMSPLYVAAADIPAAEKARVTKEAEDEVKKDAKNAKKPAEVVAKIVEGKVAKYFEEKVLMTQGYILEEGKTVEEFVKGYVAKTGENIVVRQFRRVELGVTE